MLSVFLAGLLAIQSAQAQQQRNDRRTWYQAYADAQRNIQQKNWNAAIADIEAASRLGAPKPGRNILFYGDVYGDFIPDYYLGIAYLDLNRPDDADRAFERVKQAQLIAPRDNLYAEFTRQATTVKDLLAKQAATQLAAADTTPNPPPAIPTPLAPANADVPISRFSNSRRFSSATPDTGGRRRRDAAPGRRRRRRARCGSAMAVQPPANPPPVRPTPPVRPPNTGPLSPAVLAAERSALVDFFTGQYQVGREQVEHADGRAECVAAGVLLSRLQPRRPCLHGEGGRGHRDR